MKTKEIKSKKNIEKPIANTPIPALPPVKYGNVSGEVLKFIGIIVGIFILMFLLKFLLDVIE